MSENPVSTGPVSSGLDGVIAAETVLSHVDGEAGRLILRGFDIRDLAGRVSFEALLALLWEGFVAAPAGESAIRRALGEARRRVFAAAAAAAPPTPGLSPLEAVRQGLAGFADEGADPVLVTAALPVLTAALHRRRLGEAPVAPDPSLSYAADFLRMLRGAPARPDEVRALETYLVTVADHGLNASTFTARIIASTRAGMVSAAVGALSALKGPLHGGAMAPVLDMLDEIGEPARIAAWVGEAVAEKRLLMGFGHRVYRVRDPRTAILQAVAAQLPAARQRLALAEALEEAVLAALAARHRARPLATNVEFYAALVLEGIAIPRDLTTCVFAAARVAGWTAHILEQQRAARIIRPQSRYVGPAPKKAA
jgi:citrate synthase